jgi:3-phenylpropionate/trans-cinnamate dioxygenase ferredoxin subunit
VPLRCVARVDEIPAGQTRFFCIDGRSVVIAHYEDRFYAVDGVCPHKGFEMEGAHLWGHLIDCPWHHYQYDIRTGENYFPKNVYPRDMAERVQPLASYRLELRGSEIWVELE